MAERTTAFRGSDQGLFSPEQIQRLMRIEFERAQRYSYSVVFLLIAVDRLRQLQDLYGFEIREQALNALTGLVKHATRASDFLGCTVDDRLLVLVPHTPPEGAGKMARRVLEGARKLAFDADGRTVRVTVSIGGAHNQRHGELSFETLLEVAEGGLAVASAGGGDRYVHSELYEFFEKKRQLRAARSGVQAAAEPPEARAPLPAPADEGLTAIAGRLLGDKIRELFGLNEGDRDLLLQIQKQVVAEALREMKGELVSQLSTTESEQARQIELLERRIAKLTKSLGMTEAELQRVLRAKSIDPGIASIYKSVQGLSGDDVRIELKRALMEKIFEANVELRKKFTSGT
jgi:diguanylate cyclase (GGDEF)-like protein